MADPLSISASIAGLLSIADIIIRNGYNFIRESKGAEETVARLISEVNNLSGILYSLRNVVQRFEDDKTLSSLRRKFTTFSHVIKRFERYRRYLKKRTQQNPVAR
jgi:hypothetical protein